MFAELWNNVHTKTPLIHAITNYVTVNDCANALLACGASPIMADDVGEVAEITALCAGTVLNIGTLNQRTIEAMHLAAETANRLEHPLVLDPVGVGASVLRTQTAEALLAKHRFTVIRGNASEIKTLALGSGNTQGVSRLAVGMKIDDIIARLQGIQCRNGTSCPDQLAKALIEYKKTHE